MEYTRTKKLTDSNYSATIAASEEAIRSQVDGSIQEVLDLVNTGKLDKNGDFQGTWRGLTPTQAEPGLSATVEAHLADFVSIKRYVNGDGTDETTALQNALTTLAGKNILFPAGLNVRVTSVITIPDNTVILGYGAKLYNVLTHQTLLLLGNGVKIFGLELEGAGNSAYNASGIGISIVGADASNYKDGFLLEDCYIHDIGNYGVQAEFVKNGLIKNCKIMDIGYAGIIGLSVSNIQVVQKTHIKGVAPGTASNVYGITFTRRTTDTLLVYPRSKDCVVDGCIVEDIPLWEGLDAHAGDNIKFLNNTINNTKKGIAIVSDGVANGSIHCHAEGNTMTGLGTGNGIDIAGKSNVAGTPTDYTSDCVVSNNIIISYGIDADVDNGGIVLDNASDIVVSGNILKNCYGNGITLNNTTKNITISDNTVKDTQSSGAAAYGISVRATHNECVISGNTINRINAGLNTTVLSIGIQITTPTNNNVAIGINSINAVQTINGTNNSNCYYFYGQGGVKIFVALATPESSIVAPVGSLCLNASGGASTTFYVKQSGTGNTGWVAK
jgi:parallel beta-helix repeat protein